ncbi:PadR family transcriptional regulator [Paenibacillus whitsoniae]|uniref:PadR family transcriptional regulator n=1 Tax=Paenibacillus whitsoniae TaxID=2496558 RepID=A0A430JB76_9BACL|nr:PadR family transcriptional regulator [Paenibacillus whitsoniae]RTE08288.1 PadR family transcriptional regulator [Paenibacillus whitsoniae]
MNSQDVILGLLMKGGLSGYDIKHRLESIFSYFYNASYGTIYPTLNKLEKEGFITKMSVIQEGRPNKNVYTITEEGRAQFSTYLKSPIEPNEFKSDVMTRMFFGEFLEKDVMLGMLEDHLQKARDNLNRLTDMYQACMPGMSPTQEICIQIGISNSKSVIETLSQGIERLKKTNEK